MGESADGGGDGLEDPRSLHESLARIEELLEADARTSREARRQLVPAWRRVTQGEPRWPAALATMVAIGLQFPLPRRLVLLRPVWLLPALQVALWYWEFDRGGPVARMNATHQYPDFQFVQMASPELAPPHWGPAFPDYLYLSFTNAAAFSPTDVMPLSRWAKMLMLVQSVVSLATVALVIARAVNILN